MKIFPAIDLKDKKVVRLLLGDYDKVTVYGDDPLAQAKHFKLCGAQNLHVVDLDGAKSGNNPNFDIIKQLSEKSGLFLEVGGGIRDMKAVEYYLSRGINRVILGSAAVKNQQLVIDAVKEYGERIVVGIDAKDGMVRAEGWIDNSEINYIELAKRMEDVGVKTVVFTDIDQDGTLAGPNLKQLDNLAHEVSCNIIASGGVAVLKDIINLAELDVYGAICGKAIYTGSLDLKQAIEVTNKI